MGFSRPVALQALPLKLRPLIRVVFAPSRALVLEQAIASISDLLKTLGDWVGEFPPLKQPMRFGNKAFRQWHAKLMAVSEV